MVIRGIVFDLDDTLYCERDYVSSGFRHVAEFVGQSNQERRDIGRWLDDAFASGVRGNTFDSLLEAFPAVARRFSVRDLVTEYRSHSPSIELGPRVKATLDVLRGTGLRLGILSDGPLASQSAKVDSLEVRRWFDPIVFTASLGPGQGKPATAGFQAIANAWGMERDALAYVADNPLKDFIGPRTLGWLTVRLRQPEQLYSRLEAVNESGEPDLEIGSLAELPDLVVARGRP
jgi:putative hydrolase of the HAD superfamily